MKSRMDDFRRKNPRAIASSYDELSIITIASSKKRMCTNLYK